MQPTMSGYGWGNTQSGWQPYAVPGSGGNMYWPNRGGFPDGQGNGNYGFVSNNGSGRRPSGGGSFRVPTSAAPPNQQLPSGGGYLQRRPSASAEELTRFPALGTGSSPPQMPSSANSSGHNSFRQPAMMSNAPGNGRGSFRQMMPGSMSGPQNGAPGSFRQPMQTPSGMQAGPGLGVRDPGHLAPLESPVACVPDTDNESPTAASEAEIQKELSQLMGRKTSSRRILRRKVSFQGIRMTEEERRLQAELQRLREEEERRAAAENAMRQQRAMEEQERLHELQMQQEQQQQQQSWCPQSNSYDIGEDVDEASCTSYEPPEDASQGFNAFTPPQVVAQGNTMSMRGYPGQQWNNFYSRQQQQQQQQQQQAMYGMYYNGQLPPVMRFPQQNGFPMNGMPQQMIGMYPQQQQIGRRF